MSKLEELIEELCPDGVKYASIGSLITRVRERGKEKRDIKQVYVVSNTFGMVKAEEFRENTIHSEDTSNYTVIQPNMYAYNPSRLNIGSIAMLKDNNPGLVSPMYVVFSIDEQKIMKEYFEYNIKSSFVRNKIEAFKEEGARFRFDFNRWEWIQIAIPPLPIQHEIVQVLDNFMELTSELKSELTARKKQYEYYLNSLISYNNCAPMVSLENIATEMYRGSGIKRDEISDDGNPCVRYGEIYTTYNIWFDKCVSRTHKGVKSFSHGDILFAITGENVEDIGKSCAYLGEEKCYAGGDIVVMKHNQNPKYIAYALATIDSKQQKGKGKVKSKVVHSSIPALMNISIPLPPQKEQERIVSILDRFDALCNDLTIGLPAEIEARKKQYEYYRDKLLTFKEVKA